MISLKFTVCFENNAPTHIDSVIDALSSEGQHIESFNVTRFNENDSSHHDWPNAVSLHQAKSEENEIFMLEVFFQGHVPDRKENLIHVINNSWVVTEGFEFRGLIRPEWREVTLDKKSEIIARLTPRPDEIDEFLNTENLSPPDIAHEVFDYLCEVVMEKGVFDIEYKISVAFPFLSSSYGKVCDRVIYDQLEYIEDYLRNFKEKKL